MTEPLEFHNAFYRFTTVPDVAAVAGELRRLTQDLQGTVVVAGDGINGAVAGSRAALDRFEVALAGHPLLTCLFPALTHQRTACRRRAFARMKVHERAALLPGPGAPRAAGPVAPALGVADWNRLIASEDVVLIDNRNSFEYRLGRFRGAIDPGVSHFRDMPAYLRAQLPQWRAQARSVAMYCTGGIRCERTVDWIADGGVPVYQLAGGILAYLAQVPAGASLWEGNCFVFDNRIALDARLQECALSAEDVYAGLPGEQWRLDRARRLARAGAA